MFNKATAVVRACIVATLCLPLVAIAAPAFAPDLLETPAELRDLQSKTVGSVTVSVSILTDAQEIVLNYQRRVLVSELPPFFVPLLVTRLAAERSPCARPARPSRPSTPG